MLIGKVLADDGNGNEPGNGGISNINQINGGVPNPASEIVPFAVTLEFDDASQLRKFVVDQLFRARETKFRAHH